MRRRYMWGVLLCVIGVNTLVFWGYFGAQAQEAVAGWAGKKMEVICSYPGGGLDHEVFWEEPAKASVSQTVTNITLYSGLRPNFYVTPSKDESIRGNAAAALIETPNRNIVRMIIYDPVWMEEVERRTQTDWAAVSIIAHEVGHHLQGHTIPRSGHKPHARELEADEYSGFMIARMGGTLEQAQIAAHTYFSETGSDSHPGRQLRLTAIAHGWERGRAQGVSSDQPPRPNPVPGEASPPAAPTPTGAAATTCVTPLDDCQLATSLSVGSACSCQTPLGVIPGIAH